MSKLKALLEKKASLQSEMRAMSDNITKETRAMTEDEQTKWAELRTQLQGVTSTIDALQEMRDLEDAPVQEDGDTPAPTDAQVEQAETRAFANFVRAVITKEDRADANLTLGDNGAVIPKTVAKKIIASVYDMSPVVAKATVYNTKGSLDIPVYGANSGADITVAYATEFVELESKIGKFGSVSLHNHLVGALSKLSNSLINNTDLDLVNFVIERVSTDVAFFLEGEILNGTADKIEGLQTLEAGRIFETATAGAIDADDLIKLKNKVKQAFRKNAIWIMSSDTKTAIETLKDENGRYLFNDDGSTEFDGKIKGYPVYVSDNMVEAEEGNIAIYFGDFSGVALKWSEQLEVKVLREKYATQHATGINSWFEADAKVENNQKIAGLKVKEA
jgi:HK97 family phage major capsid protein